MTEEKTAIDLRQLSFRYSSDRVALDALTFTIRAGERIAIVGPSGAGESTLLMHWNGLFPNPAVAESADAHVFIQQTPIIKSTLRQVRQQVGFLFQDPDDQLFCPSVREDVAFGPLNLGLTHDEVRSRVEQSLADVGLPDYGPRNPAHMSTGERKRVCLAGVFACHPSILVLDEPTSNLDPRARRQLLGILQKFNGTQVIATHDLDFALDIGDRVIVLDEGKVRADGQTSVVFSNADLMNRHGLEVPWRLRRSSRSQ